MNVLLYSGGYDSSVIKELLKFHKVDFKLYHADLYNIDGSLINKQEGKLLKKNKEEIYFKSKLTVEKREEYVPCRNSLLVMDCANKLAHIEGEHTIFIGLIENAVPFPDCTVEWLDAINELLYLEFDGRIVVVAPFVEFVKDLIFPIGNTLGVDLSKTYSCNHEDSEGKPCGKCGECLWRKDKDKLKVYKDKKGWSDFNEQFEELLHSCGVKR